LASKWPRRPDLLSRWSRAAIPVKAVAEDPARRARLVGAVVRAMEGATVERRAWRPARWQVALAAVAVVLLVAVGAWRGSTAIGRLAGGGRSLIGDSHPLDRDGGVFTSPNEGSSGLRLPSGVVVATGPRTRFEVPDVSALSNTREEIVIESGLLRVEVPRLPAGHVFAVRTPDTLVTVHGTSFSVEVTRVGPSAIPTTKVVVTHGVAEWSGPRRNRMPSPPQARRPQASPRVRQVPLPLRWTPPPSREWRIEASPTCRCRNVTPVAIRAVRGPPRARSVRRRIRRRRQWISRIRTPSSPRRSRRARKVTTAARSAS
jgi:hypothetical protein